MDVSQQQDGLSEISSDESGKKLNDKYQSFSIKCIENLHTSSSSFSAHNNSLIVYELTEDEDIDVIENLLDTAFDKTTQQTLNPGHPIRGIHDGDLQPPSAFRCNQFDIIKMILTTWN